ncbi:hypothetical protein DPEC_G00089210 [Dallia pectoralis]|uniref:Uncharacterized protein n=1 Tax=Dallia pectoralis TaxID=75939 RepID=A0ACC2H1D6_DALPE|nr:hypothetical protein DPEC_G00089210 [Dallia pectoralis]
MLAPSTRVHGAVDGLLKRYEAILPKVVNTYESSIPSQFESREGETRTGILNLGTRGLPQLQGESRERKS